MMVFDKKVGPATVMLSGTQVLAGMVWRRGKEHYMLYKQKRLKVEMVNGRWKVKK